MPKLMLEEDANKKEVLVKIGQRTSIRQIINFCLEKIKKDWKVTLNAFQLEMTKALQACEIIKTRLSFLHQENKLISHHVQNDDQSQPRIRSGISISLCRNHFEVTDEAGYQKPKPRTFLQPPMQKKKAIEEEDLRKTKPKKEEPEDRKKQKAKKGGKKKQTSRSPE